ncbi:AAEL002707-PA [Aedes aegypti]|uniref:AAEL002707-PA n=1 Tax=Aedes aegypti TaxID=7159 RepID=Q17HD4_AEDAE|nr:AAEL002707-PA [Aedes aegypti]
MKAQVAALLKELAELRHRSLTVSDGPSGSNSVVLTERVPDFREIREYVTPFDPKLPSCPSAEVWVKGIDETGDVYMWYAAMRLHCTRLSLMIKNWDEFKAEIVKGFSSAKNPIYYHNLLSSRKWKSGETVEEYVYEMLAMGRKGGFTEETIVTYITSGLRSYVRRSGMTIGKVFTVQGLLEELRWIDSVDAVATTSRASDAGAGMATNVGDGRGDGRRKTETVGEPCYHCHETGHIARNCPKVKCHLCKRERHMKRDCRGQSGKRKFESKIPK